MRPFENSAGLPNSSIRLIFFPDSVLIVELGVGDLMDGGADRLHLAHAFADSDALFVHGEVTVHILRQLLKGRWGRARCGAELP